MPAISWSQFDALPDVLGNDRFQLLIAPTNNTSLAETLAIRLQQVAVPEESFEPMMVGIQGFEYSFRGRRVYDRAINGTFVETIDGAVSTGIANWMQDVGGGESGNSITGGKPSYSTQGTLYVYDQSGNTALTYDIDNCWPSQAPTVQLDGTQTTHYAKQIQFTYDRFTLSTAQQQ